MQRRSSNISTSSCGQAASLSRPRDHDLVNYRRRLRPTPDTVGQDYTSSPITGSPPTGKPGPTTKIPKYHTTVEYGSYRVSGAAAVANGSTEHKTSDHRVAGTAPCRYRRLWPTLRTSR